MFVIGLPEPVSRRGGEIAETLFVEAERKFRSLAVRNEQGRDPDGKQGQSPVGQHDPWGAGLRR